MEEFYGNMMFLISFSWSSYPEKKNLTLISLHKKWSFSLRISSFFVQCSQIQPCYICITLNSRLALIIFKRLMQQHFEIFAVINNHKSLEIYIPIVESKHKNYYSTEQNKSSNTPFRKTTHTAVVSV